MGHTSRVTPRLAVLFGCLTLAAGPLAAQIPAAEQVQTFSRIFAFDRALSGGAVTVVLVGAGAPAALEGLRAEFERAGMTARTTTSAGLATDLGASTVVYFAPDAVTPEARDLVANRRALSVAAEPDLARTGRVSVALDPRGDRIGIVVNAPRLEAEGHALSPQLLKQAWVEVTHGAGASDPAGAGSDELAACVVTRFTAPDYPTVARRMSVEGTVQLRVLVGADLGAEQVEVVESVRFLDDAAVRAASASRYSEPGWCSLAIPFQLEAGG